jgi:hypothetical protein
LKEEKASRISPTGSGLNDFVLSGDTRLAVISLLFSATPCIAVNNGEEQISVL